MNDQVLVWLSVGLIVVLTSTIVLRTALVERAAGSGGPDPMPFRRPLVVRRLDWFGLGVAVLLVAAGILRIVFGTLG